MDTKKNRNKMIDAYNTTVTNNIPSTIIQVPATVKPPMTEKIISSTAIIKTIITIYLKSSKKIIIIKTY